MLDELFRPYPSELQAFAQHWCGPDVLPHWTETLIATYPAEDDGQPVDVYVSAGPARFYTIKALAGTSSVGESIPPVTMTTGSGQAALAAMIAEAMAAGMLGVAHGGAA